MVKFPVAKKVVAEMELHAGMWDLIGVKAGKAISIDEARKNALELDIPPLVKASLHTSVTKLESAIWNVLIVMGKVAKDEHTFLLVSSWRSIRPGLSLPQELWSSDGFKVINTAPSGIVKVTPKTEIKILLKRPLKISLQN